MRGMGLFVSKRQIWRILSQGWVTWSCLSIWANFGFGLPNEIPHSLPQAILSETHPFVLDDPAPFQADDFEIEWLGQKESSVHAFIEKNSIQWTRVREVYVLPQGRVRIEAKKMSQGVVEYSGFSQPFSQEESSDRFSAAIPVALVSGEENPIKLKFYRQGKLVQRKLVIRFKPKKQNERLVLFDPSCSPFDLKVTQNQLKSSSWIFVSCRFTHLKSTDYRTSSLELYVYWDQVGQSIRMNQVPIKSTRESLWTLRLQSQPGAVSLVSEDQKQSVRLAYQIPEENHRGFLGAGIGPYAYTFTDPLNPVESIAPVATLYGAFSVGEGMRIVTFNALVLHERFSTDWGVFFMIEQNLFLDQRISLRLLLGGHVLGFFFRDSFRIDPAFPQGVELVFSDFLKRRYQLSMGAFLYPKIKGTSYNNLWLRWGPPEFFIEYNYISWTRPIQSEILYSRSHGISVGIPITGIF